MFEFSEDFLRSIMAEHLISDAELNTLRLALNGKTAKEIAETLSVSAPAVRKRLGAIYSKFQIPGDTPGKLEALKRQLKQKQESQTHGSPSGFENIPDVSTGFSGRVQELQDLEQWIVKDQCRLIAILGMGGIGKTSLAVKLALGVRQQFDHFVWQGFRHGQSPEEFLRELLIALADCPKSNVSKSGLPDTFKDQLSLLLNCLQTHRYLIVLDSMESILRESDRAGHYQPEFKNYGNLLWELGIVGHQSCVVITSREKPKEIAILQGRNLPVRSLSLKGLDAEEAKDLFEYKGEFEFKAQWDELVKRYGGNPLALKIIAASIGELFGGNVAEFLNFLQQTREQLFGDVRNILEEQFERLSALEKEIMYWLAINYPTAQPPTSSFIINLGQDILSPVSPVEILEATESLIRRSLIDLDEDSKMFRLQPVVIKYTLERLIYYAAEEVKQAANSKSDLYILRRYAFLKACSSDSLREQQFRLILQPLADHLLKELIDLHQINRQCFRILDGLRYKSDLEIGYTAGNLLNLFVQLGSASSYARRRANRRLEPESEKNLGQELNVDLTRPEILDWSGLVIRQAYLPNVNLPDLDFTNSQFIDTVFRESFGNVFSVTFSPNGIYLAAGHSRGDIHLWRIDEQLTFLAQLCGKNRRNLLLVGPLKCHHYWVNALDFSPDSRRLASGSQDETLKIWEIETKTCLDINSQAGRVWSVAWRPDGQVLASGCENKQVKLWDTKTGKCLKTLSGHNQRVRSVAWSPDGQWLASGGSDCTVRIWDAVTGDFQFVLEGHAETVMAVTFAPNPDTDAHPLLATASEDATIKLWDLSSRKCLRTLTGHSDRLISLAFSPDGQVLASAGKDRQIILWLVETGDSLTVLKGHHNRVWSVAFHPNGKTLVSGSDDQTIKLWDVNSSVLQTATPDSRAANSIMSYTTLVGYANQFWSVDFSPDGRWLATGSDDKVVRLYNTSTGVRTQRLEEHTKQVRSVAFSRDGSLLASGSDDQTVRLWDVKHAHCQKRLRQHTKAVRAVAFSPDGKTLASGSDDSKLKLWDVQTGQCLRSWTAYEPGGVLTLAFSSNGQLLASGGEDTVVKLWTLHPDKMGTNRNLPLSDPEVCLLEGNEGWVWAVAFSPNGKVLASGGEDNLIRLWNPETAECFQCLQGHKSWIRSLAFTPDGKTLISGSADNTVKFWDVETATCVETLDQHNNWVTSVAVSPDGHQFASGSADETVRLWDLTTPTPQITIDPLHAQRPYEKMKITGIQFPHLNGVLNSREIKLEDKSKVRNAIAAQKGTLRLLGAEE
ncbi:MAG: NB-ARC domain-containing protein [Microcoleaceae cyanobacterium]